MTCKTRRTQGELFCCLSLWSDSRSVSLLCPAWSLWPIEQWLRSSDAFTECFLPSLALCIITYFVVVVLKAKFHCLGLITQLLTFPAYFSTVDC